MATVKHNTKQEVIEEKRSKLLQAAKAECENRIYAKWPDWKQRDAERGAYGYTDQDRTNKNNWVDSHLQACEELEALINQATDPGTIDPAADKHWP